MSGLGEWRRGAVMRWVVVALVVGIGAWMGVGYLRHLRAAAEKGSVDLAETAVVTRGDVEKSVESSGKVVANLDVDIKCRASGEVVELPFDISQKVKKGDLLCQLDPTDEKLAVRSAEVAVSTAEAKLAQARYTLEEAKENLKTTRERDEATLASAKVRAENMVMKEKRQQELFDQKLASQEDLESVQTDLATAQADKRAAEVAIEELKQQEIQLQYKEQDVKMAEAQLATSQIALETQKKQLDYTTVTAPMDATVSALSVQKGTIVASGMSGFSGGTTIMTLSDLSRVFMTATVDESDIGGVEVGQAARIKVASFPGREFAGKVVRKATKGVNSSNVVTFEVKVEVLDDRKELLQPEMTGTVTIVEEEKKGVLTLPQMAVDREGKKNFVTTSAGVKKEVGLGLEGADTVEVKSGVREGERVVLTTAELPTRWKSSNQGPPPR